VIRKSNREMNNDQTTIYVWKYHTNPPCIITKTIGWVEWIAFAIPATREVKIRRIVVQVQTVKS
jgi:hypothetical protein